MTSRSAGSRMVVVACSSSSTCWSSSSWKVSLFVLLLLSLQVLVESYLHSASFGHTVTAQCIQCFLCPSTVGASFFGILYVCSLLPCINSALLPYSGYVTIVFASSALVGHGVCLPAQQALMCSQNMAWSGDPLFWQP